MSVEIENAAASARRSTIQESTRQGATPTGEGPLAPRRGPPPRSSDLASHGDGGARAANELRRRRPRPLQADLALGAALPPAGSADARDVARHLRLHPAFASLPRPLLESVAATSLIRQYGAGEAVTRLGRHQHHVIVLVRGALQAQARTSSGTRFLSELYVGPMLFGDENRGTAWRVSTQASEPSLTVWIERTAFAHVLDQEPSAAAALYHESRRRLERIARMTEIFAHRHVGERIVELLSDMVSDSADPDEIGYVNVSRAHLARSLASDRKTVERNLRALTEAGVVRIQGRRMALLKVHRGGELGPKEPVEASTGGLRA